ncbi:class E sortase [Corynebacterium comes]|uniref:Sortase family protein n=1 Tax=Corynebacterium comes TaxID=2675218 RepID=A0A6B8W726_9CORY|nr:class E sortase [Corynebacterium comes]QGU05760.1 Sortase family protein [Corynebacterium comes]
MSHQEATGRGRISVTQVLGELLLTVGVVILLFAFYESYWTNIAAGRLQDEKASALEDSWGESTNSGRVNPRQRLTPELGEAFARMYIPSFGSDFRFAIVEGTDDSDLVAGPGRYVESQLPGQAGNFAVAGHRVGKGAPFNDLGNLQVCDAIVVETQAEWITYRVLPIDAEGDARRAEAAGCLTPEQVERVSTGEYAGVRGRHITLPGDIQVINPVPGQPTVGADPGLEGIITLTTCHPQFSNAERMIVHAMEVESTPKIAGTRPAVLEES